MKTLIVFQDGKLLKTVTYPNKTKAKLNYRYFLRHGMLDPDTGEVLQNTSFELI